MNEDKASRYQRRRRRAALLATGATAGLLGALLCSGASRFLGDWSAALAARMGGPPALQSALSATIFTTAAALPVGGILWALAAYQGLFLDRRYGVARPRVRPWIRELAGSTGRLWLLAVTAAVAATACLGRWPTGWWMVVWAGVTAAAVVGMRTWPAVHLARLERDASAAPEPLARRIASLAARAGVPVVGVLHWRTPGRSPRTAALVAGVGHARRIVVSDTVVTGLSDAELDAVLAHELAHVVHGDAWTAMGYRSLAAALALWVSHVSLPWVIEACGLPDPPHPSVLPALALAGLATAAVTVPVKNALSRRQERRADCCAVDLTGDADALVSAIRRMAARTLSDGDVPWWMYVWFSAHPTAAHRMAAVRERAARAAAGRPTDR